MRLDTHGYEAIRKVGSLRVGKRRRQSRALIESVDEWLEGLKGFFHRDVRLLHHGLPPLRTTDLVRASPDAGLSQQPRCSVTASRCVKGSQAEIIIQWSRW